MRLDGVDGLVLLRVLVWVAVVWVFVGVIWVCCGVCVLLWFTVGSCGFRGVVFCGLIVQVLW